MHNSKGIGLNCLFCISWFHDGGQETLQVERDEKRFALAEEKSGTVGKTTARRLGRVNRERQVAVVCRTI